MSKKTMVILCAVGLIISTGSFVAMDNGIVACFVSVVLLLLWARCE
jgi:hypothetical protein